MIDAKTGDFAVNGENATENAKTAVFADKMQTASSQNENESLFAGVDEGNAGGRNEQAKSESASAPEDEDDDGSNPSQKLARDARGVTLLLSAGAGSGKSRTLVARLVSMICDQDNPCEVTDLLVVTFTVAAAAELRHRVGRAVAEKLAKEKARKKPNEALVEHLSRQLSLFPVAQIMTVDSFCLDYFKRNAGTFGYPPQVDVIGAADENLIAREVMENVLSDFYDGVYADKLSVPEFLAMTDAISGVRGLADGVGDVLYDLYRKTQNNLRGTKILFEMAEKFTPSMDERDNFYLQYVLDEAAAFAKNYEKRIDGMLRCLGDSKNEVGWADFFEQTKNTLAVLGGRQYGAIYETLPTVGKGKHPSVSQDGTALASEEEAKDFLERMRKDLEKIVRYFAYTEAEFSRLGEDFARTAHAIATVADIFGEKFLAEKKRRAVVNFNDVERAVYESLWQNGEKTENAKALAENFKSILIDEYQDISPLQHAIFEGIASPTNRFMVGDIKQSIYVFRSADPRIFAEMKTTFPPYERGAEQQNAVIYMSDNYRSAPGVIDTVNEIFGVLFEATKKDVGYTAADALICHHDLDKPRKKTEFLVPESPAKKRGQPSFEEEQEAERLDNATKQAYAIAEKIRALTAPKTDGSPVYRYRDCVILFRYGTNMPIFVDILNKFGIPAKSREEKNFFKKPSVMLAISLLSAVDNPARDVPLCGAMLSPIFGFTPDELLAVRRGQKGKTLWESLGEYAEAHPDFTKGADFIATLENYRALSAEEPVERLLYRMYYETGLLALAEKNGEEDNLWLLFEYARGSGDGFRGLGTFVRKVSEHLSHNEKFDAPMHSSETEDEVQLITIHSSKGLEYPVVFLAECDRQITDRDARKEVVFADGVGFAPYYRDEAGLAKLKNPMREVVNDCNLRTIWKEEMRLFYVALTRATQELYLVGCFNGDAEAFKKRRLADLAERGVADRIKSAKSYFDFTLLSAADTLNYTFIPEEALGVSAECMTEGEKTVKPTPEEDGALAALLTARFAQTYPDLTDTQLPEKMSVSALYPTVLDEEETVRLTVDEPAAAEESPAPKMPKFISGVDERLAAKRGIATHAFLQFADFRRLLTEGKEAERERLLLGKYLSPADGDLVRMDEIQMFVNSELAKRMVKAQKLYRELRFHVTLPAEDFTTDAEKKKALAGKTLLVQGVMDCVMVEADGTLTLLDYKTDRLPREIRRDRDAVIAFLNEKHARQLSYYREAVKQIFGKYPDRTEIYSLAFGDTLPVG